VARSPLVAGDSVTNAERTRMAPSRALRTYGHRLGTVTVPGGARLRRRQRGDGEGRGLFVRREQAERFLKAVRADEPELAEPLRLEAVERDDCTPP
jgi:hypothetical protein